MTRRDFEHSPLIVFYEVTQACDLLCQHCRACAQTAAHPGELTPAESLRLIDQLSEFPRPPMVVLTGGDPLKRPDIFTLTEHAIQSGLEVSLTPSATPLVTPDAIQRFASLGISRLAISLDGADAATHDANRGVRGSFDRSLRILEQARAAGLRTQINTTLTSHNIHQIARIAELAARCEVVLWSVFFLVPVGRARHAPRLSAEACEAAFEQLWRQAQRQPYAIKTTEAPHYRRFAIQHRRSQGSDGEANPPVAGYAPLGVNDGKGIMFISHLGQIYPSGFLPLECGAFPGDHVVEVYQDSQTFRALRDPDQLEGKCQRCEFRHICGGSRARAFAVTGNPFSEEPDCVYVPE